MRLDLKSVRKLTERRRTKCGRRAKKRGARSPSRLVPARGGSVFQIRDDRLDPRTQVRRVERIGTSVEHVPRYVHFGAVGASEELGEASDELDIVGRQAGYRVKPRSGAHWSHSGKLPSAFMRSTPRAVCVCLMASAACQSPSRWPRA